MKKKWIDAYMDTAERFSQLSSAVRLQVGCVVVRDHRILSIGYNGMPAGWDNECEYKSYSLGNPNDFELKTKPQVIHAEANAIIKLGRDGESGKNSIVFITHAPCIDCAKLIYGVGVETVYFRHTYRSTDGLDFLNQCGIKTIQI